MAKINKSDVSAFRLRETIGQLPDTFRTRDVSEHPDIQRALARFSDDPQFHQVIGIALSDKASQLGIACIDDSPNATWQKSAPGAP